MVTRGGHLDGILSPKNVSSWRFISKNHPQTKTPVPLDGGEGLLLYEIVDDLWQ